MLTQKEEIQSNVKQYCHSREDVLCFAKGWLKNFNASKAKKQELQKVVEEIKWILEAGEELPDAFERLIQLKNEA